VELLGMSKDKLYFAPLPPRALGDKRLAGLHLRVLGAVALHDRMAGALKKGQGCWAGPKGIAAKCGGANLANVCSAITDLTSWGYLESRYHPDDRRKRVLHVVYNDDDTAVVVRADSLPNGKQPHSDRLPGNGKVVCPTVQIDKEEQSPRETNIFCEAEDISLKRKKYSVETAPSNGIEGNVGAELAKFERLLKSGVKKLPTETLQTWGEYLTTVHFRGSLDDPNAQRAGRMIGAVEEELFRRGAL
jgi:hypothetical protein